MDLYEHAAGVLVRQWEYMKNIATGSLNQDDKFGLLRGLAYRMQGGDGGLAGNYILEADLRAVFEGYLVNAGLDPGSARREAQTMIEEFQTRDFVLSRHGPGIYGFVHRAFLEFFCAGAVVKRFQDQEIDADQLRALFAARWRDPSWREVLRLIVGRMPSAVQGALINELLAAAPRPMAGAGPPRSTVESRLAAQCLTEVRNPRTSPTPPSPSSTSSFWCWSTASP